MARNPDVYLLYRQRSKKKDSAKKSLPCQACDREILSGVEYINRSGISKKNPGVFEHQQHIRLLKMFHGAEKKGALADA